MDDQTGKQNNGVCHCGGSCLLHRTGVIESNELFAERNEVEIRHEGQVYRLRITKNGKLILNK